VAAAFACATAAAPFARAHGVASPDCHAVKFVGVRGSGDTAVPFGLIAAKISGALVAKAHAAGVDYGTYGLPYTAVGIAFKVTMPPAYWLSERQGRNMLRAYIREQTHDCPSERLLVEGYSQGAQVVGDVFSNGVGGLDATALARIAGVALLADPRFNSRESYDHGTFRLGRNGILGARSPGDLTAVSGKIAAWCRNDDIVCQGPGSTGSHDQTHYWDDYGQAVVAFLAVRAGLTGKPPATTTTTAVSSGWPVHRNDGPPALFIWLGASFIMPSWSACTAVYCIVGDDADQRVLVFKIKGGIDELGWIAESQDPRTALAKAGFGQADVDALLAPTG